MEDSVHIVRGYPRPGLSLTGWPCVICGDTLTCGPSFLDPAKHRMARVSYWREWECNQKANFAAEIFSTNDLVERLFRNKDHAKAIYVWVNTSDWADSLFMIWATDSLANTSFEELPVRIVLRSFGELERCTSTDHVAQAMAASEFATRDFSAINSKLWRAFASGSPLDFGSSLSTLRMNWASRCLASYAKLFPTSRASVVFPSLYDSRLLTALSMAKWTRPIDLVDVFASDLDYMSLDNSRRRLAAWASITAEPFVTVCGDQSKSASEWKDVSYKLTARGESLVNDGIARLDDAPPMWIGAVHVYSDWCYDEATREFRRVPDG
jgi:hypothetical protein